MYLLPVISDEPKVSHAQWIWFLIVLKRKSRLAVDSSFQVLLTEKKKKFPSSKSEVDPLKLKCHLFVSVSFLKKKKKKLKRRKFSNSGEWRYPCGGYKKSGLFCTWALQFRCESVMWIQFYGIWSDPCLISDLLWVAFCLPGEKPYLISHSPTWPVVLC